MTEVFSRYGEDHTEPGNLACTVRHPEAGGQCEREAVGEVWALPFCEVHGREAELAYKEELSDTVGNELEALAKVEETRFFTDKALLKAIGSGETLPWVDYGILDAAQREAYPPEELEEHTDPDTLRYPYHLERREQGPVDWWHGARFMVVGFMRRAHEAGAVELLKDLELVRERATVQQLLAERDMDQRYPPKAG